MLEVIDKGSCTEAHPVPLLFVHGGWHGAWCWDDQFLGYFADAGYRAVSMSLRGHGASPPNEFTRGWKPVAWQATHDSRTRVAAATKSVGMLHFTPAVGRAAVSRTPRLLRAVGGALSMRLGS